MQINEILVYDVIVFSSVNDIFFLFTIIFVPWSFQKFFISFSRIKLTREVCFRTYGWAPCDWPSCICLCIWRSHLFGKFDIVRQFFSKIWLAVLFSKALRKSVEMAKQRIDWNIVIRSKEFVMFYWKMLLLSTLCVVDHLWPLILCSLLSMLSTLVHWYQQCVTVHYVPRCMSCQKAIVVITGRVYCFHDNIYITLILLLWDLNTLWVVDHLWPYIYIYWLWSISIWAYSTHCLYLLPFEKLVVSYTKLYFGIVSVSYSAIMDFNSL